MGVQTFCPEAAIERFDEGVVGRLAWPGEVEHDASLIRPQVQVALDKFGALIDPDRCRESYLPADPFEHLDNVDAAEGEARLQGRREARVRVDDSKHAKLLAGRQLVVHEVHRPRLVRSRGWPAIVTELGFDPTLGRFVAQLQA